MAASPSLSSTAISAWQSAPQSYRRGNSRPAPGAMNSQELSGEFPAGSSAFGVTGLQLFPSECERASPRRCWRKPSKGVDRKSEMEANPWSSVGFVVPSLEDPPQFSAVGQNRMIVDANHDHSQPLPGCFPLNPIGGTVRRWWGLYIIFRQCQRQIKSFLETVLGESAVDTWQKSSDARMRVRVKKIIS